MLKAYKAKMENVICTLTLMCYVTLSAEEVTLTLLHTWKHDLNKQTPNEQHSQKCYHSTQGRDAVVLPTQLMRLIDGMLLFLIVLMKNVYLC